MVTLATRLETSLILFVEGSRHRDHALEETLSSAGHDLLVVNSGDEAVEEYAARLPDLVVLGRRLTGCDAAETCRRLYRQYGDACAPVLLMSREEEWPTEIHQELPGVIDVLPEAAGPSVALAHIRAHLKARRHAARQQALVVELREELAAKRKLLSMCAHDLRTPLASVCGLAEFLQEPSMGALNPRQAEIVEAIREASDNTLKLVNQFFDVATLETGTTRLDCAPVSLREVADRAVFLANVTAARKRIRLVLQPASSAEPAVMMDAMRIREVVDNLLSNAVKYSPYDSCVGVAVELLPAGPESSACVRFSVRDQGPGVPAGERHLLFRDFSRLSACPTGGEKSTGLGLAICRKIIDLHGGSIGAVNHPEGGCVFSFILPVSPCN